MYMCIAVEYDYTTLISNVYTQRPQIFWTRFLKKSLRFMSWTFIHHRTTDWVTLYPIFIKGSLSNLSDCKCGACQYGVYWLAEGQRLLVLETGIRRSGSFRRKPDGYFQ